MKAGHLAFHRDESVSVGVIRFADSLIGRASSRIQKRATISDKVLHEARVTIKCLRAILRLIRPSVNKAFFRRENARLRRAARQIAPFRDVAVARKTLDGMLESISRRKDQEWVRIALRGFADPALVMPGSNQKRASAMRRTLTSLEAARAGFHALRLRDRGWKTIEPGLKKTYRQNRYWMNRATVHGSNADFHEWRKRAKYLFYQMQWLTPICPRRLEKLVEQLNELQDSLGADHDLVVLKSLLRRDPNSFGGHLVVRRLTIEIDRRSGQLRKKSQKSGRSVFAQKPARFTKKLRNWWKRWKGL